MEAGAIKQFVSEYIGKYRILLLILLAGILLMTLPEKKEVQEDTAKEVRTEEKKELQDALSEILSLTQGAGEVKVLLTLEAGEKTIYQADEAFSADSRKESTVLITDSGREEKGLINQVEQPVYRGAIILCQGADNAAIRLHLVDAVANATGLTTDRITVLKMK